MVEPENLRALKTGWLCCLLVQVKDDIPQDVQRYVERVVPICAKHHGVIADMMASLQLIAFGLFGGGNREETRANSRAAKDELLASLGRYVRIVAFDGDIAYGNIGTDQRMNYTILAPEFGRFLSALLATEFGGVSEVESVR